MVYHFNEIIVFVLFLSIIEAIFVYLPQNITSATQDNFKASIRCILPGCKKMYIFSPDAKLQNNNNAKNIYNNAWYLFLCYNHRKERNVFLFCAFVGWQCL